MASPDKPPLEVETVRGWVTTQLARAGRAAGMAERHQRLWATARTEQSRAFHLRMATLHRSIENRCRVAARLHDRLAARLEPKAGSPAPVDASPGLLGAVAAELGSPSVGITLLSSNSSLGSVGASDATAEQAQSAELGLGEGPVHDVVRTGGPVTACLEPPQQRWLRYSAAVGRLGVRSVIAVPLVEANSCLGALTVFDARPAGQAPGLLPRMTDLAEALTHTILFTGSPATTDAGPTSLLLWELDQQPITHQASGMVAAQCDCTLEEALALISARAFAEDRPVRTIAQQVVNRVIRFDGIPGVLDNG